MRILIRLFFKSIRLILGPVILFGNWITMPRGIVRTPEAQYAVDATTRRFLIYKFKTCPFCIKVMRTCKRLSLNIETCDAQHNQLVRKELLQATGKIQVPCLRITMDDGSVKWLLESKAIVNYLQGRFGNVDSAVQTNLNTADQTSSL